jgi:hypothetical protein
LTIHKHCPHWQNGNDECCMCGAQLPTPGDAPTIPVEQLLAQLADVRAALGLGPDSLPQTVVEAIRGRGANVRELADRAEQAEAERDGAYRERAQLLALLATHYPAVLAPAPDVDEEGWQILYLDLPTGQASWHIAPRDGDLLGHLAVAPADDPRAQWDGHTTAEKYGRIARHAADRAQHPRPALPRGPKLSNVLHVSPIGDLMEHDTSSSEPNCPCDPAVQPHQAEDGQAGWLIVHHSLDGREHHEGDQPEAPGA